MSEAPTEYTATRAAEAPLMLPEDISNPPTDELAAWIPQSSDDGGALDWQDEPLVLRATSSGQLDVIRDGVVEGWAFSPSNPDLRLRVEIWSGEELLALGVADQMRQDLVRAGIGDGCHAFRIPLPSDLRGGQTYSAVARVAGELGVLQGGPISFRFPPADSPGLERRASARSIQGPGLRGVFEIAADGIAEGWAWDERSPEARLIVELVHGDQVIATGTAERPRADLRSANVGDGAYGVRIAIPTSFEDGAEYSFVMRVTGTNYFLEGGPRSYQCKKAVSFIGPEVEEEVADYLELASLRASRNRYAEANRILMRLVARGIETADVCLAVGRNHFRQGSLPDARQWLLRAASLAGAEDTAGAWAQYELACLQSDEGDLGAAATTMARFVEARVAGPLKLPLGPEEHSTMLRVGHGSFRVDRAAALMLYRGMLALGAADYLARLRIIEALLDENRLAEAATSMTTLAAQHKLDAWGRFAEARLLFAQRKREEAVIAVLAIAGMDPTSPDILLAVAHRLLEFRRHDMAARFLTERLEPMRGQSPALGAEIAGVEFRIDVQAANHSALLAHAARRGYLATIPLGAIVEGVFVFARPDSEATPEDDQVADVLAGYLEGLEAPTLSVVLALYHFCSRRRSWDRVGKLESRIRGTDMESHREVRLRRFEVLCAMSRLDEALAVYRAYFAETPLQQWEACSVLRFLAEMRMWDDATALLERFIVNGHQFAGGEHFMLQICRKTSSHAAIIATIDRPRTEPTPHQHLVLRELLLDDLVVARGSVGLSPGKTSETAIQPALSPANRLLRKPALGNPGRDACGFLCVDRKYFMSVLTFFSSFATAGAAAGTGGLPWHVFLARDVPTSWHDVLRRFCSRLDIEITIVSEHEFVGPHVSHAEEYGIFTGGATLSRAAFFRLYAARYLLLRDPPERAYYVDSDIICHAEFAAFAELGFDGAFLMARPEETSVDVRDAAARHGLTPSQYFNSGVLAFNFSAKGILQHIDAAIDLGEREPTRLVFHDQCALNIAFAGKIKPLGSAYNYFLRPYRNDNGDYSSAILLHFLATPKPWDVSFNKEYRVVWLQQAQLVRALLPSDDYNAIVAAANQ